jgi:hypothetical protein
VRFAVFVSIAVLGALALLGGATSAAVGNLRVEPAKQALGKTVLASVECNAGDLISLEGSVGYFLAGTGKNARIAAGAVYCEGGAPLEKTMSAEFLCVNTGYAILTYGAEKVVVTCGDPTTPPPNATPTPTPQPPTVEGVAGQAGSQSPGGPLRAPSTGDAGLAGR